MKDQYDYRKILVAFVQSYLTHYEWHLFNPLLSFQQQNSYRFWCVYWYSFSFNIVITLINLLLGNGEMLLHKYVQVEICFEVGLQTIQDGWVLLLCLSYMWADLPLKNSVWTYAITSPCYEDLTLETMF